MKSTPRQRLLPFARREGKATVEDAIVLYRKEHTKKPAFVKIDAPKTDPAKNIWFWRWAADGKNEETTCSNVPNQFARHWCRVRAFALSVPCECCPPRGRVENRKPCGPKRP